MKKACLRRLRKRSGETIYDIAKKLDVSAANVSRLERGTVQLTVENARRLAGIYNTSVDEIVGGPLKRRRAKKPAKTA